MLSWYLFGIYVIKYIVVDKSTRKKGEGTEKPRSIRLSRDVWNRLDADAERCQRSSVKQLEAVLRKYFRISDVDINFERTDETKNGAK
jgi:hypothetical protein